MRPTAAGRRQPRAGSVFWLFPPMMIFLGSTTFPTDLDIFMPLSSSTNPCVKTFLYGAMPSEATDVRRELWNHPLCWSLPSR